MRMLRSLAIAAALALAPCLAIAAPPTHVQTYTGLVPIPATNFTEAKIDNAAASGDTTIVAAVSAQTTKVYKLFVVCNAATNITFKDGSTALTGAIPLGANGSITLDFDGDAWFTGSTNTAFKINSSAATQCSGRAYYVQS